MVESRRKSADASVKTQKRGTPAAGNSLTFEHISRHQRKRERTRSLMLDATASLIADRDPGDFAICDITKQAGVANGTFYYYFTDKAEIVAETAIRIAKHLSSRIYHAGSDIDDPVERIAVGLQRFIYFCIDHPTWAKALSRSVHFLPDVRQQIYRDMSGTIQRGIDLGEFDVDDKELAYDLLLSAAFTAARAGMEGMDPYEAAAAMSEMQLRALGVSKEKARLASRTRLGSMQIPLLDIDENLSSETPVDGT